MSATLKKLTAMPLEPGFERSDLSERFGIFGDVFAVGDDAEVVRVEHRPVEIRVTPQARGRGLEQRPHPGFQRRAGLAREPAPDFSWTY